jgi:uncharacterized protein (TIRG00374 family)
LGKKDKKSKKTSHISNLIRIAIAVAALYFAFKGESFRSIAKIFSGLSINVFLAALVLNIIGQLVFVFRWLVLLRAQQIKLDYLPALKLHFLGLFYNNCLPGAIGGDVLRAWYVTMHTEKKIEAALSVIVDRIIGFACTIALVFLSYWLIPGGESEAKLQFSTQFDPISLAIKLVLILVILIVLAVIVLAIMYKTRKLRPILLKYAFLFAIKWKMWVGRITNAVKLYCSKPFTLLLAVVLSFTCQVIPVFGLYLVGKNLGIEAHIKYYYVFFPLSWVIGAIPISVGGAGVMELGLKGLFGQVAKVTETQGLILALTQRFTWLLTSIPGVIIHLTGKHLPDKKEMEAEIKTPV